MAETAPADLVSAERVILHYKPGGCAADAPAELVSAERMIVCSKAQDEKEAVIKAGELFSFAVLL